MSESLVVIRTFGDLMDADDAQVELLSAGIHSLLLTDDSVGLDSQSAASHGIALAVHRRDVHLAEAVLTPRPHPA